MDFSKELEQKVQDLITVWADEYLIDKPVAYAWALNSNIHKELEKATKALQEAN